MNRFRVAWRNKVLAQGGKNVAKAFGAKIANDIVGTAYKYGKKRVKRAAGYGGTAKKKRARKASVKSNSRIAKVVKKVLAKQDNHGVYYKNWCAINSMPFNTPAYQTVLGAGTRDDSNVTPFTGTALQYTFFSRLKLLDALSVLYNAKADAINYELTNNNFTETGLKAQYSCSVEFTMNNQTDLDYEGYIYIACPKYHTNDTMEFAWRQGIKRSNEWKGTVPSINTLYVKPGMSPNVADLYKVSTEKIVFRKGETRTITLKYSGILDYDDLIIPALDGPATTRFNYIKNVTKDLTLVFYPLMDIAHNNLVTRVGRMSTDNKKSRAMAFEVKEYYKVTQPGDVLDTNEGNPKVYTNAYEGWDTGYFVEQNVRHLDNVSFNNGNT